MIGFLNEAGRLWYEPFGFAVVQNTLFLGVIFAALYWLRNASARVRYAVAVVGLVKLITPPFLPSRVTSSSEYIDLGNLVSLPYQPIALPGTSEAASPSLSLAGLLALLWCTVALGVLVHAVVATMRLHRSLGDAEEAWDDESTRLEWRTGVRVRVSENVPVPMTVGVLPATIFVPPMWNRWTPSGRRAVLRHELAHIHRRDGIIRALETLVRALYWFHPLVPLLMQRIDVYREQACDERAAAPDPEGRLAYSQLLVEIAEHLLRRPGVRGSASALLRRRNELLGRVHYLTREETTMKLNKGRAAALAVAMVVALISLSWYHTTATPQQKEEDHATVELSMARGGKVAVGGEKTTLKQVGKEIKKQIGDENAVIHIKCDKDVRMGELFAVHAILREAGMYKVSYAGLSGSETPMILPSEKLIEKAKSMPPEDVLELKVECCGKCVLAGMKVAPGTLSKHVMERLDKNESLVVSLTMSEDATFGDYLDTLRKLKLANAQKIFINEPSTL